MVAGNRENVRFDLYTRGASVGSCGAAFLVGVTVAIGRQEKRAEPSRGRPRAPDRIANDENKTTRKKKLITANSQLHQHEHT